MFLPERKSQLSPKEPTAGPSRHHSYAPVYSGMAGDEQQQQSHNDKEMVTINLEGNGHSNGVSYIHPGTEAVLEQAAGSSLSSCQVVAGNKYFPNLNSLMSTSCHTIRGKLSSAGNSGVACAKSWWNSFQNSYTSMKESILTMATFPDPIMPLWTLRIRAEYTSADGSLVTDTDEIQNFPSKEAAELYLKRWTEKVRMEGCTAEYIVELFLQCEEEVESTDRSVEAMQRHALQYEISQQDVEEGI